MTTIVTRETGGTAKGSPLTNTELDNNFINLNDDKLEASSNLSDLANAATARQNLGVEIGVDVQAYDADTTKYDDVNPSFTDTGALKIPVGTEAQRPGTPAAGQLRFNDDSDEFEGYNGTAWASVGGAAISNDTSTSTDVYPLFSDATTGTAATVYTSNSKLLYKPSTGELKVSAPVASNGIVVNADTMTSNYTIDSGTNGLSVGPFTIDSGVTLTIASGQRHLIL
jgi:hypothetical protein